MKNNACGFSFRWLASRKPLHFVASCCFVFLAGYANASDLYRLSQQGRDLEIQANQILAKLKEAEKLSLIRTTNALKAEIAIDRADLDGIKGSDFHQRMETAFDIAARNGMDVERLRKYLDTMRKSVRQAEFANAGDKRAQDSQRIDTYKRVSLAYMDILTETDPKVRSGKFQSLRNVVQNINAADAMLLEAEAESIAAEQKLVADIASGVPILGEVLDVAALATGENLAGEQMGKLDTAVAILGLLPGIGDLAKVAKSSPEAAAGFAKLSAAVEMMGKEQLAAAAKMLKTSPEQLAAIVGKANATEAIRSVKNRFSAAKSAAQAETAILKNADSLETKAWRKAQAEGRSKADGLMTKVEGKGATLDDDVFENYKAVRQDPQAVKALKESGNQKGRELVSDIETKLFGSVDEVAQDAKSAQRWVNGKLEQVGGTLNKGDGIVDKSAIDNISKDLSQALTGAGGSREAKEAAKRLEREVKLTRAKLANQGANVKDFAIDPNDIRIEVFNASNAKPKRGDIGSDRDITYRLVLKDGSRVDVPSNLVEPHYSEALYKALNPKTAGQATRNEMIDFAKSMDHAVTDHIHREAYRVYGRDGLGDVIGKGGKALGASTAESVADTMADKGLHWLAAAEKAMSVGASQAQKAEGMRQMVKQVGNQILPRIQREGLDVAVAIPPKLSASIELFKRVEKGAISPAQAEAGLKAIGMTMQESFIQIGQLLPQLEKLRTGLAKGGKP